MRDARLALRDAYNSEEAVAEKGKQLSALAKTNKKQTKKSRSQVAKQRREAAGQQGGKAASVQLEPATLEPPCDELWAPNQPPQAVW